MQVEITIKVDGKLVGTRRQEVGGTLEQMEETIHTLSKRVAADTLQSSVEAVVSPRPLFRKTAAPCDTAATRNEPSSDCTGPSLSVG
jgi:hypothetical protein